MPKANRPRHNKKTYNRPASPTWFDIPPLELKVTDKPERLPDIHNTRRQQPHHHDLSHRPQAAGLGYDSDRFRTWSPLYEDQPVFHHPPTPRHHHRRQRDDEARRAQTQRERPTERPYRPPHFAYTERLPDRYASGKLIYRPPRPPSRGLSTREYVVSERRPRGSGCRHCHQNHHHHPHHHRHRHHNHHNLHQLHKIQHHHRHHPHRHKHHHHPLHKVYPTTGGIMAVKWNDLDGDDYDDGDVVDDDDGESSCCSECCCCQSDSARVRLFSQDGYDPYSCTCFPKKSSNTIPAMMYDGVRCPHPEHQFPQGKQDVFAYPWTVQTYRPTKPLEFGYRQGQVKPPSAVTAPPFATYDGRKKELQYDPRGTHDDPFHLPPIHQPGANKVPHTAPVKQTEAPLLSSDPSDRRLRRADRNRLQAALQRIDEEGEVDISPFDSISQVSPEPPLPGRQFRPPSLRLRTVDEPMMRRADSELRGFAASRHRALSTPRGRPLLDDDGFPQTPTRIFKGEYIDPNNGKIHRYNIKYGKQILGGTKSVKTM